MVFPPEESSDFVLKSAIQTFVSFEPKQISFPTYAVSGPLYITHWTSCEYPVPFLPVLGSDTHADFEGIDGVEISTIWRPPGPQVDVPIA